MKFSTQRMGAVGAGLVKIGRYVSLIAPICIVVAGIIVWTSVGQVSKLISTGAKSAESAIAKNHPPKVNRVNLDTAAYAEIIKTVGQNNPAVRVVLGENKQSMVVFVTDPAQMPEWMFLLSTLQAYKPGLIWSADSICLKKCAENRGAVAVLQAYTQQIVVN